MIKLIEHSSPEYAPRTWHNAKTADFTVAFAINQYTPGEKLTKKAAGEKYLYLNIGHTVANNSRLLLNCLENNSIKTLNIAGNGLQHLRVGHITQYTINIYLYKVLSKVNECYKISKVLKVLSGGQTGVDFAAGVACQALNINCEMTFPKGFRQRDPLGRDVSNTKEQLMRRLDEMVEDLTQ